MHISLPGLHEKPIRGFFLSMGVVVVVLILSAYVGQYASWIFAGLTFTVVGGGIFAVLAMQNFHLALTALILVSAASGITINTGRSTPLPIGLLLVGFLTVIWVLKMAIVDRRVQLALSPLDRPMLFFLVTAFISWMLGYVIWDWKLPEKGNLLFVQAGQYAVFAGSYAALLLTANHQAKEGYLKKWTTIIVLIGLVAVIFNVVTKSESIKDRGVTGGMLMWPFVLLWAQLLFNSDLKPWVRVAGWLTLPLWIFWAWNYVFVWKGGWVPALVGLVFLLWFKYRRFVTIGLVVAVIFVVTNWGVVQKNLLAVETTTGSDIRPLYWYDVIRMTSSSVLLGLGPANYAFYWRDPTFVPLSRIAAGWDKWNAWGYAPPSHNMYVDVYAQTGLIGLGFFVWGIIAALLLAYRLRTRFPAGFLQAYVYGVLCGFASLCISSFLFADWLLPFVYNITITGFSHSVYSWLLLGTLVALDHSHEANHEPVA